MRWMLSAAVALASMMSAGCGVRHALVPAAVNRLNVTYVDPDGNPQSAGGFSQGIYRLEDRNHLTILLYEGQLENPARLVTIRMLWKPRAGSTPVDRTATNATIHYIDFSKGPAGIFSGAGFMLPSDPPAGLGDLKIQVTQSTLRLADHADGYPTDPHRASLSGRATVARDDEGLMRAMHRVEQRVLERLGYPRLVNVECQCVKCRVSSL